MKLETQRQKITLATTFPVFPPRDGYAYRIFHLYRHLISSIDIEIISLGHWETEVFQEEIYPGLKEIRIPKSNQYQKMEESLQQKAGIPVTDIVMAKSYSLIPDYVEALRESIDSADLVVICNPYLLPLISQLSQKPLWYEALDLQSKLKRDIIANQAIREEIVNLTLDLEKKCCEYSQLIITPSPLISHEFIHQYSLNKNKLAVIQNGIEPEQISSISYDQRLSMRKKLGLEQSSIVLFTTDGYLSIDKTTRFVLRLASKLKNFIFLIAGPTGLSTNSRLVSPNVSFIEQIDHTMSTVIQRVSDVVINPAKPGSYTDFKILEYLSNGIPLISTRYGYRHMGLKHFEESCYIAEDVWQFSEQLIHFNQESHSSKIERIEKSMNIVQSKFTWPSIAPEGLVQLI